MFVTSQCGEDEDKGQWLVSLLSGVLASAEETQISKIWIIEPQKDKIGIFLAWLVFRDSTLLCVLMKYNANVKTSNVVFKKSS